MSDEFRSITPEERDAEREVHAGAQEAGVRIAGLTEADDFETSFAGGKDGPVEIGHKITVRVRVAEDGTLLPRRENSDSSTPPATSILTITVIPSVEFDSSSDPHVVWNGYAHQVDVATTRVFSSSRSGPSKEEEDALRSGRPAHEYGNDAEYKDGMLAGMARSRSEAVANALAPLVGSGGKLAAGREDRPARGRRGRVAAAVAVPIVVAGIVFGVTTIVRRSSILSS